MKVNMSLLNLFIILGVQKNLLPGTNIWEFPNQFAPNLWNSEDHIRSEHPSSVSVDSMEQVTIQEILIPLQQNMVVIYKAVEAEKHSIGRVIHFDANMVSLEMFQSNNKGEWKSISELVSLPRKCIVYGPIKLNKRGTIKKFLLNNHVDWNF